MLRQNVKHYETPCGQAKLRIWCYYIKISCFSTGHKKKREKYDVIILSLIWLYFTVLTRNSDVGINLPFLRLVKGCIDTWVISFNVTYSKRFVAATAAFHR